MFNHYRDSYVCDTVIAIVDFYRDIITIDTIAQHYYKVIVLNTLPITATSI